MSKHLCGFQPSDTESDNDGITTHITTENTFPLFPTSPDSSMFCSSDNKSVHKRARSLSSNSLSGEESDSHEGRHVARRRGRGSIKPGSSWAWQKSLRDDAKTSKNFPTNCRLDNFHQKIYKDDPHAEFRDDSLLRVHCSACTEWLTMRVLYDIRRWKDHRATKKCLKNCSTGFVTSSLFSLGFAKSSRIPMLNVIGTVASPCPGLSRNTDRRIDRYMSRTSSAGGGAPSRRTIAKDLFKTENTIFWKDLTAEQQKMVLHREELSQLWKISHPTSAIFSSACEVTVYGSPSGPPRPCSIEVREKCEIAIL